MYRAPFVSLFVAGPTAARRKRKIKMFQQCGWLLGLRRFNDIVSVLALV
jgi:hypothetical protein